MTHIEIKPWMDGRTSVCLGGWMNGWIHSWLDGRSDEWMESCMYRLDRWMDGYMHG